MRASYLAAPLLMLVAQPMAHGTDVPFPEDAALRAVHFVDSKEGWAVGDEGGIWHSIDGGQTWEQQQSGVRGSLRSVTFLNPYIGWAAGREEMANGQGSVGVLLFTRDGGEKWQRILHNALPGLNQVKFIDPKTGFVVGDGTEQFATGIFKTMDGGRSWEPIQGPRSATLLACEFVSGREAILGGAWSRLATLRSDGVGKIDIDTLGGRAIQGMANTPRRAIAVGQGGLVLSSTTAGARWGYADVKLPTEVLATIDWNAIASVGNKAWIAGRPGTVLLHTKDGGDTWQLLKTGQPLPLHGVFFLDDKTGWAVGEMGLVLATTDGGQSWNSQRQGGKHAAAMLVHALPKDVPLDTLAQCGADEGYLVTALRLTAPDPSSAAPARACDPFRFSSAVRKAGGAAGEMLWQFPLPQHLAGADTDKLLAFWGQAHGEGVRKEMLRQMVLALRMWRPAVVIADHPTGKETPSIHSLASELTVEALKQAADATSFPEQIERLGLETWRVSKLYHTCSASEAHVSQNNDEFRGRLRSTIRDFAAGPAELLTDASVATLPGERYYRLLHSIIEGADRHQHLMQGIATVEGETRRKVSADPKEDAELRKAILAGNNLRIVADKLDNPARTLAQIAPTLAKLPDDQGAAAAFAIANQYVRKGQWTLAREAFLLMVDRYPSHPLSADAYRWLIRHVSSSEARRRHELEQFVLVDNLSFPDPREKRIEIQQTSGVEPIHEGVLSYLSNRNETRRWYEGSLEIGKRLAGFGPLYGNDPTIQFCLQASRRHLGDFKTAQDWYAKYRQFGPKGPWSDAAAAELWLQNRGQPMPKKVAVCRRIAEKPFLDGVLDDECWKGHNPLVLENAAGDTAGNNPTEAWFAYDQQYLYIALRCKHPSGRSAPPVKVRTRDADLDAYDRVSILLDLDRDYSTYFHLQVDQRGCVREDCWGDLSWNPRWFVAVKSAEDSWTIEAAIPLAELSRDPVALNTAWAVNVVRILPGRGVQGWSLPADVQPRPEGMSLMIFQQDAAPRPAERPMKTAQ
ncbi:MAG: hypothetical protein HY040_11225 [Planctomycetes bacterium]|nr:hypothetical protein [Planctomycetota bacterium]